MKWYFPGGAVEISPGLSLFGVLVTGYELSGRRGAAGGVWLAVQLCTAIILSRSTELVLSKPTFSLSSAPSLSYALI